MADVKDCNGMCLVIDFVNHAVIPHSNPPAFSPSKFLASERPSAVCERRDSGFQSFGRFSWQGTNLTLGPREDKYGVTHLRERSLSCIAFRKGIACSPEAFAAS